jgi:hypothetical protein
LSAEKSSTNYEDALQCIWRELSAVPLYCACNSGGIFAHLGTVPELLSLLTASDDTNTNEAQASFKLKRLAQKYQFKPTIHSVLGATTNHTEGRSVLVNSYIGGRGNVGEKVLIEHSVLTGSFSIDSGSVASHIPEKLGRDLHVKSNVMIEVIPLYDSFNNIYNETYSAETASGNSFASTSVAIMLLGISDDVKLHYSHPSARVCGSSWSSFFNVSVHNH